MNSTSKHTHFFLLQNKIIAFFSIAAFFVFFFGTAAYASNPVLSLVPSTDGNNVALSITGGDPNASVIFYYTKAGSGSQFTTLGTTDSNGSFQATISSSSYGIVSGALVHISTGGVNGSSSAIISWPNITSTSAITLSQSALLVYAGQSTSVTATTNTAGSFYVSNNSNPAIATINISGNQINVIGNTYGSTIVSICSVNNSAICSNLYITVQNSNGQPLSFNQNNVTLSSGQTIPITITGGNGSYAVVSNSNSTYVQSSLNGSVVTLSTTSTYGSSAITVCSVDMIWCGIINATVTTSTNNSISFSQQSPTLSAGQSVAISIYGGSGSAYYISSNTNPSVVQASVSGSTLTIIGLSAGSSSITICSSSGGGCSVVTPIISYTSNTSTITLGQTNVPLQIGQTQTVSISGSGSYYISSNTNQSVAQATVGGSNLSVTGLTVGSTTISVCQSNGQCATLYIGVSGSTTNPSSGSSIVGTSFLTFSSPTPTIALGQSTGITISGGVTNAYTVVYNSSTSVVSTVVTGSVISLTGVQNGYAVVVVCDTYNNCGSLPVHIGVGTTIPPIVSNPVSNPTTTTTVVFTTHLAVGSSGSEVTELQKRLTKAGVYKGPINGKFGPLTSVALKKYQKIHKITPDGNVGPLTRALLNK